MASSLALLGTFGSAAAKGLCSETGVGGRGEEGAAASVEVRSLDFASITLVLANFMASAADLRLVLASLTAARFAVYSGFSNKVRVRTLKRKFRSSVGLWVGRRGA